MRIQAAILDWAGTVVDHGSRAPMGAFVRAFAQFGVVISIGDASGLMGMAKWDHIRAVGQIPSVAAAWRARHGRDFAEGDVDAISSDNAILLGYTSQDPNTKIVGPPIADEPYGMAISKKHPDFVRFVNGMLARMRADGR